MSILSCGAPNPVINVNGIDIYQREWDKTINELTTKFKFETECAEVPEFILMQKSFRYPTEVGAMGCGEKLIFWRNVDVVLVGPWNTRKPANGDSTPNVANTTPDTAETTESSLDSDTNTDANETAPQ